MKKLVLLSAVMVLPAAHAWAADTQDQQATFGAEADRVCELGAISSESGQNVTYSVSGTTIAVNITALADPNTATANAATLNLGITAVCNQWHTIVLESTRGGLQPSPAPASVPSGFAARVDYTASAGWTGPEVTLTTAGSPGATATTTVNGPESGSLNVSITIPRGSTALIAGSYTDTLTLELLAEV